MVLLVLNTIHDYNYRFSCSLYKPVSNKALIYSDSEGHKTNRYNDNCKCAIACFSLLLCVLAEHFTPIVGGEKIHFSILSIKNTVREVKEQHFQD